jgi:hypothetical protein
MELDEKETKTALEGLYVSAKHNDSLAVAVWCKKLDEIGVGFRAQNYIFSEASRDFSPGIPSGKINVAFDIALEQYSIRRVAEMANDVVGIKDGDSSKTLTEAVGEIQKMNLKNSIQLKS